MNLIEYHRLVDEIIAYLLSKQNDPVRLGGYLQQLKLVRLVFAEDTPRGRFENFRKGILIKRLEEGGLK